MQVYNPRRWVHDDLVSDREKPDTDEQPEAWHLTRRQPQTTHRTPLNGKDPMAPSQHCPYDPSTLVDTPFDLFPCPVCGCAVLAGQRHGPCLDPICHFYDPQSMSRLHHPSTLLPTWR
jgi:hypothetical protein